MHRLFPEDVRVEISALADPSTDRAVWPEYGHMYEEWGWFGHCGDSCPLCGLKVEYWPQDVDDRWYAIATGWNHDRGQFHYQSVCSKRCEDWDLTHPLYDHNPPSDQ